MVAETGLQSDADTMWLRTAMPVDCGSFSNVVSPFSRRSAPIDQLPNLGFKPTVSGALLESGGLAE
jgi:hypothetical protein